ncbi:signal peptide peptidase-domain-containing protein [Gloeopeniophorella convolvens]|nr:signal peptide peptidase-domain-containing protein [Gloeopeniophorella convolvens]
MSNGLDIGLLSAYVGITTAATISVYAGSIGTLPVSLPRLTVKSKAGGDRHELQLHDENGRLTSAEAWIFPVLGSVMLGGLYLAIKFFGTEWINWLLVNQFTIAGLASVPRSAVKLFRHIVGTERWKKFAPVRTNVSGEFFDFGGSLNFKVTTVVKKPVLILAPLGILPSILYTYMGPKKSALLTDILALSFAHDAMSLLKLDTFKTGCILLSGLFVYDIWWVFGTQVMVSVATSLDLPMKIIWPKSITFSMENGSMLLGLGDIVVPGMFVALALRYDYFRHKQAQKAGPFAKPYFHAALAAYVAGLATTMTVMHVFHAAQPALLYLSPACILSFVLTALVRGELADAWSWSDGEAGPDAASEKKRAADEPTGDAAGGPASEPSDQKASDGDAD